MPIERLASLVAAAALVAGLLIANRVNPEPLQFASMSLLTLLLWRASAMPLLAMGAGALFCALAAWHPQADAADFLAGSCGVLASGGLLLLQAGTPCAEASPQ
jgi:hypothetical protein